MCSGPLATIPPDRGCDLAPRCLECPFPECRYDGADRYADRPSGPHLATRVRAGEAAQLRAEGCTVPQIAQRMGCHHRQVHRYLAIARAETGEPSRPRSRPQAAHLRD